MNTTLLGSIGRRRCPCSVVHATNIHMRATCPASSSLSPPNISFHTACQPRRYGQAHPSNALSANLSRAVREGCRCSGQGWVVDARGGWSRWAAQRHRMRLYCSRVAPYYRPRIPTQFTGLSHNSSAERRFGNPTASRSTFLAPGRTLSYGKYVCACCSAFLLAQHASVRAFACLRCLRVVPWMMNLAWRATI